MTKTKNKLGFQCPKGYVKKCDFSRIEIEGSLHYCQSHNFVYDKHIEERKLHDAIPCFYTDSRYLESEFNHYDGTSIYESYDSVISVESCIRKTLAVKNIPVGTIVTFQKSYIYTRKDIDTSYKFKVKKENHKEIDYTTDLYVGNFSTCERSIELVNKLRENGFIVQVRQNFNRKRHLINTALAFNGRCEYVDSRIEGEVAIAYGHGKRIGFSSYNNDFIGYYNGEENILYNAYGSSYKWSMCEQISKNTPIDEIIEILKK